jgi:EAL domain-containing protein (putative c-di-GMP-specific phosphodiesterase class I)/ActR/RegA family two-component response regulator
MLGSAARGHILVVDDDPGVRRLFVEVLQLAGYATVATGSVAEAAAALERGTPEIICVLLDAGLPDGRGLDLLRRVRSDLGRETLPVIVVTGDDDARSEIEGLEAGATDYLLKPVSPEALVARVGTHLRDRAAWLAVLDAAVTQRGPDGGPLDPDTVVDLIGAMGFRSVFQPIVDLRTGERAGYEALTRFHDGTAPEQRFVEAAVGGYGPDLELATLASAVEASHGLPADAYVSLNVTPGLLRPGSVMLQEVLGRASCPIVLEITEREAIDDYDAVRSTLSALEPSVRLSVDDAGAGFASLRHVVMLEPDYVKLDRTWVSGIDHEPTKQAMVAGLVHFANATGCTLVAEGIERSEEQAMLTDLGVRFGQGFLLGRPESVA